jgi:hypothetical protein
MRSGGDVRPIPDPTELTTEQLRREVSILRELIELRLTAVDRATLLLNQVTEEKFRSMEVRFLERDRHNEHTHRDSKSAIDAALLAAKEAVHAQNESSSLAIAKSEVATNKQIDQQGNMIVSATRALSDKIDDIKSRLTLIEGKGVGVDHTTQYNFNSATVIVAAVATFISLGSLLYTMNGSRQTLTPVTSYIPAPSIPSPSSKD